MLCARCNHRPAAYKVDSLCRSCHEKDVALKKLETLTIYLCEGGCGKRLHNIKYLKVPNVPQGHGPGSRWCHGCYTREKPRAKRKDHFRGPCLRCERPMAVRNHVPAGYVEHQAKGYCKGCYNRRFDKKVAKKRWAAQKQVKQRVADTTGKHRPDAKLNTAKVLEIKKRLLTGEGHSSIARDFGVHRNTIYCISTGRNWRFVRV